MMHRTCSQPFAIWLMFAASYASQHLATSFISVTLIVLLREQGVSLDVIGLFQLAILPYSLRFLLSPVIERVWQTKSRHFKNWLLLVQWVMVGLLVAMAFLNPVMKPYALFAALTVFALMIGIQDVALDGLACRTLDERGRTLINSTQVGSGMVAGLIAGVLISTYPLLGWRGSILLLMGLSALPLPLLYRYREAVAVMDSQGGLGKEIVGGFVQMLVFWRHKKSWLAMLALYGVVYAGSFTVLSPSLVDNGWQMEEIGLLQNYGTLVGLVAVVAIIPLTKRLSRLRAMQVLTALQLVALGCVLPLAMGYATPFFAYLAMTGSYLTFAPMFILNSKTMMDFAASSDTPATLYSTQISVAMLISIMTSSLFFALAERIGYQAVLLLSMTAALLLLAAMTRAGVAKMMCDGAVRA